jgi:putative tricarboxylic transport membrane protein
LMVLVPTILYVLATQFVGIYVASAIFIAAFMRVMDKRSWFKVMLVSVGVSAALFWLFEVQFRVPLPKGPLEALFGY